MPELPEVEHICRYLRPRVSGRRVAALLRCDLGARSLSGATDRTLERALRGRRVEAVERISKLILLRLDRGPALAVHLRMTGCLWAEPEGERPLVKATRLALRLEGKGDPVLLALEDQRRLGTVALLGPEAVAEIRARTGPDSLLASEAEIAAALSRKRGRTKPALLDQEVIAGVGNIYADEALHRARLHPTARLDALAPARLRSLAKAVKAVIAKAVGEREGVDVPDQERVGSGRRGVAARRLRLQVYQRAGMACTRCGGEIARTVVGGRGTYYCPECQPEQT